MSDTFGMETSSMSVMILGSASVELEFGWRDNVGGSSNAFVHAALVAILRGYCFRVFRPCFGKHAIGPKGVRLLLSILQTREQSLGTHGRGS